MSSSQHPEWVEQVAAVILQQLGGASSLRLMLGRGLQFEVVHEAGRGAGLLVSNIDMHEIGGQVTAFRVLLAPSDTYDVEIFEGPREALRLTDGAEDIYDDMLIECVENRTGYILTPPFRVPSASHAGMLA